MNKETKTAACPSLMCQALIRLVENYNILLNIAIVSPRVKKAIKKDLPLIGNTLRKCGNHSDIIKSI